MKGQRPTVATISLAAVRANYAEVRRLAGAREPIAVVKADAYGHGATAVAKALADEGCPRFAVVTLGEAAALREAGLEAPILLLGGVHGAGEADDALGLGVTPVVHHRGHVERLGRAASGRGEAVPVHVEVDTGMSRMGVPAAEAVALLESIERSPTLVLEGVYTHFARADEADLGPTREQLARFQAVLEAARERGISPGIVHTANSAGLVAEPAIGATLPETHAVRPGLMLYGAQPTPHTPVPLQPAMTLRTQVVAVRDVPQGTAVGYSALYRAPRPTRIATLAIGYADGVPVSTSGRGCVLIRGQRRPIAGRVSMDFVSVDLGGEPAEIGDEAVLFGEAQGARLPVEEAAASAGTISYELLVRVGSRVPREIV